MKIPKEIKVGAHTYKVKFEKDLETNHKILGQSRHTKGEIIIDIDQTDSQIEDTLFHEILHCIDWQVRFAPSDSNDAEDCISRITPLLLTVLKENKLLK